MRRLNVVDRRRDRRSSGIALLPVWRPVDPDLGAPQGVVGLRAARDHRRAARPGAARRPAVQPAAVGLVVRVRPADLPVAIDSRIELFPASVWDAYDSIVSGGEAWEAQLRRLGRLDRGRGARGRGLRRRGCRRPAGSSAFSDVDGSVFLAPGR